MAKKCKIEKNKRIRKKVKQYAAKWAALKEIAKDMSRPPEERFAAYQAMQKLPRNSHPTRVWNICHLTGRAHGYHRKYGISRIKLRELASEGMIPGVTKSSW